MRRARWVLAGGALVVAAAALAAPSDWFSTSLIGRDAGMQHAAGHAAGVFDEGDLANYQRRPAAADIVPAVEAQRRGGPEVAGDAGDVLVLRPDGAEAAQGKGLLVRRALAWVAYDAASGLFDVPALGLEDVAEVTLPSIGAAAEAGYVHGPLRVVLAVQGAEGWTYPAGQHRGWVTKGDRYGEADQGLRTDGSPGLQLVQPAWVEAKLGRVIDAEPLLLQVGVGLGLVLGLGTAWMLLKGRRPARAARPRRARGLAALARATCDACGTAWSDLAFCLRCGAHRQPANRWTPETLQAARRVQAERRR